MGKTDVTLISSKGKINPSNISTVTVNVSASASTGTATVTAGSIILGFYSAGNQDQLVDNVAIASTTLTVTLAANATAQNNFKVVLLVP